MFNFANCDDKRAILQEIDPEFDVDFDTSREQFVITHKGHPFQRVGWNGFDRDLVTHIRKVVWQHHNGIDINAEIEENNAKVDKDKEEKVLEMARNMARDIRKPLVKEIYGI